MYQTKDDVSGSQRFEASTRFRYSVFLFEPRYFVRLPGEVEPAVDHEALSAGRSELRNDWAALRLSKAANLSWGSWILCLGLCPRWGRILLSEASDKSSRLRRL